MNILIFGWRDTRHPLAGGAEQVVHEHAKGWIEAGHEVTLFSSRFIGSPKEEILDGVKIIRGGYQYLGVQIAAFFFYLKNKNSFDFVIDQFHGIPFFTPLYVNKPKIALIQEVARNVWFLNPLPLPINLIIGTIGYLTEPIVFLLYKNVHFLTGSESAKKDVTTFGILPKNITVIPHGVVIKKPKKMPAKEKINTVTYLGILSKDKGIEDAIKTFSLLNKIGKWRFWVIGRAETKSYEKKIKNLAKDLNLGKKIKFWGYVSQAEKFELLAKSHLLINPSIHEGWGLVNIEANTFGVPVVAYRSPGLVDSVKEKQSGILCNKGNYQEMAKLVYSLLNNQNYYKKLSGGAIKWAENFDWEKSRRKSLSIIKKLIVK